MEEINKELKFCPLKDTNKETIPWSGFCLSDKCAWWCEDEGKFHAQCALTRLAYTLIMIYRDSII